MSKRITIEELQSYLWNSAVLLRTNIDAGAYKQYTLIRLYDAQQQYHLNQKIHLTV